jgi:hypothetical protein
MSYQPRNIILKDEKIVLRYTLPHCFARCKNNFSQLFNVHGINDVRQNVIQIAEPLVIAPRVFETKMVNENVK